ncbi:TRAP transporter substrate-binding protein [Litorimonas sp. WD9-15]|uniref:TRAP transporter substrate-binding protein n=1 Tax=Litorimonas sp. WD9-15 TaxID=3418716 RepID=UPI003D02A46B
MIVGRRRFIYGSAAGLSGLGGFGLQACTPSADAPLRTVDILPEGFPTVIGLEAMRDDLLERSGGRLQMKIYPGAQLGAEKDTLELTVFGGLDIARVNIAPLNAFVPETRVPSLPFMFRSIDHMRVAMDGAPGQIILESMRSHGLVGLAFYDSGARSFYTSERSINDPSDLSGLKIRVQNSDLFVSMIRALGGNPTPIPLGEVYQGLLQGVIDGAENNWPSYESFRHFETAPYYSLTRHVISPEVVCLSLKTWERLSEADREMVQAAARVSVPIMRAAWDERVETSKSIVSEAAKPVTVTEPPVAPFQEKVQAVWAQYLDSPRLQEITDMIQSIDETAS